VHQRLPETENDIVARDVLRQLRPPELYVVDETEMNRLARYIAEHIGGIAARRRSNREPEFTTDLEMLPKNRRCNRPTGRSYRQDREFLFIDVMYGSDSPPRSHVTSLAIQRDIFVSFFGEFQLPEESASTPGNGPFTESVEEQTSSLEDGAILPNNQSLGAQVNGGQSRSPGQSIQDRRHEEVVEMHSENSGSEHNEPVDFAATQSEGAETELFEPPLHAQGFENFLGKR
jgi:hypothetical protein